MKVLMIVYDNESYTSHFPIGLAYLATAVRDAGHSVEIYQQDIFHWPEEHLVNQLNREDYDVVMISVIGGYYQYRKLLKLSEAINSSSNREKFKYLIGGHGPAADPEYFLKITGADVVGVGEGELTIIELFDAFNDKRSLSSVDGIAYLDDDGKYILTPTRELIQNIDDIPFPAYDLFDMTFYTMIRLPNSNPSDRVVTMLSGRGCTFECNFCYRLDKGFRPRTAENILAEIKYLMDTYNVTYIGFFDELLMTSAERTRELCEAFIESGLNFKWECCGRLNYADVETLELMKKSGCVFINYGIESLDNPTLKVMKKGLTTDIIKTGVENTLQVGISPGLNIIYGNIEEPLDTLDDALDFLLEYDDHAQLRTIRPVTPYPGSPLFDYAVEKGLIKDTDDFYNNKHLNSDLMACNFTNHTDEEVYHKLYEINMKLIESYQEASNNKMEKVCKNLYYNQDASFRGFR